jgi:hypothetical protein
MSFANPVRDDGAGWHFGSQNKVLSRPIMHAMLFLRFMQFLLAAAGVSRSEQCIFEGSGTRENGCVEKLRFRTIEQKTWPNS